MQHSRWFAKSVWVGAWLCLAPVCTVWAAEIKGVSFADHYRAGETTLVLTGTGLLRYRIFIKAYVAVLYLGEGVRPGPVRTGQDPRDKSKQGAKNGLGSLRDHLCLSFPNATQAATALLPFLMRDPSPDPILRVPPWPCRDFPSCAQRTLRTLLLVP